MERRHETLKVGFQSLKDKAQWAHFLPGAVAYSLNTLRSTTTGVSPAEVELGHLPRGPVEQSLTPTGDPPPSKKRRTEVEPSEPSRLQLGESDALKFHVQALRESQRVFTGLVQHFSEKKRQQQMKKLNERPKKSLPKIKVGDIVKAYRPRIVQGLPKKAFPQWRGPYQVLSIGPRGYELQSRMKGERNVTVSRPHVALYTADETASTTIEEETKEEKQAASTAPGPARRNHCAS